MAYSKAKLKSSGDKDKFLTQFKFYLKYKICTRCKNLIVSSLNICFNSICYKLSSLETRKQNFSLEYEVCYLVKLTNKKEALPTCQEPTKVPAHRD
jgi:hypothetical protein